MSKVSPELSMWMRQVEIRLAMLEKSQVMVDDLLKDFIKRIEHIQNQIVDELLGRFK